MRDKSVEYSCAAELAVELLQGKWRIQILCVMRVGPVRLGQLGRLIPSASKKVLAENLRNVEYDLAEPVKAATYQLLDQLARWGDEYEAFNSKQE
jgi:hypothetical protein